VANKKQCSFETGNCSSEGFDGTFVGKLIKLQIHDFVAHQPSVLIQEMKYCLRDGEIVVGDVA
jgi:hypothetical protein